ncbi:MAG: competence/damage-inducible protein A [Oscillospiraceae bacterium]|nr:competence/damage-inducible protein A [Oscillospiraceae bacterium]
MKAEQWKAEILCVGTELLLGDIVNTNAKELSAALRGLGIGVYWQSVVGDNPARLRQAVQTARDRANLIITTGGLGPTYDDLTKDIVCETFGVPLVMHEEEAEKIRAFFAQKNRQMPENNLRQAMLPEGCTVFSNFNGTAPGFAFVSGGATVIQLPGPPREMRLMLETGVIPYLRGATDEILVSKDIRIFGLGESSVEARLHDYMESLVNPTLAPYAGTAEVRLRATAMAPDEASAEAMLEPVIRKVREELGDLIYAVDEPKLESVCLRLLKEKGLTFAAAESCTGGLIAKRFTDQSGASSAFMGGVVCYTNYVKHHVLGVPQETLDEFGAVSAQTAAAMAEGARRVCGSDLAVSVTGCAGPNSDERGTPVGTGFVGFASPEGTIVKPIQMGKDREWARVYAASFAFDLIRRYLTGCLE